MGEVGRTKGTEGEVRGGKGEGRDRVKKSGTFSLIP